MLASIRHVNANEHCEEPASCPRPASAAHASAEATQGATREFLFAGCGACHRWMQDGWVYGYSGELVSMPACVPRPKLHSNVVHFSWRTAGADAAHVSCAAAPFVSCLVTLGLRLWFPSCGCLRGLLALATEVLTGESCEGRRKRSWCCCWEPKGNRWRVSALLLLLLLVLSGVALVLVYTLVVVSMPLWRSRRCWRGAGGCSSACTIERQ